MTPLVECMSSYISRLATAHCVTVSDLMKEVVLPRINKPYLLKKKANVFFDNTYRLHSQSRLASKIACELDHMTHRNDLSSLTLIKLRDFVSNVHLVNKTLSWCPACLNDWREKGDVIYVPLLWSFYPLSVCIRHSVKLENLCPSCRRHVPFLSRKHVNGICPHCRGWLGSSKGNRIQKKTEHYAQQVWFTEQIGFLLSKNQGRDTCCPPKLSENLPLLSKLCRKYDRHGRWTSVIDGWLLEDITPSIDSLLEISYRLSVPLESLLTKKINESDLDVSRLVWHPKTRRQRCQLNVEKVIEICMKYYLGIVPDIPPSLKFVASEIGCDISTIRSYFPELASQISNNYVAGHKEQTRVRHEEIERAVQTAIESIVADGGEPTFGAVKSAIPHIHLYSSGVGYKAWQRVLNTHCAPYYPIN